MNIQRLLTRIHWNVKTTGKMKKRVPGKTDLLYKSHEKNKHRSQKITGAVECVCVCVCVCVLVYVVYEDTNLYNNMGMTEVLQFEGVL